MRVRELGKGSERDELGLAVKLKAELSLQGHILTSVLVLGFFFFIVCSAFIT